MSNLCAFCGRSLGSVLHTGNIRWVKKFGVAGRVMACEACAKSKAPAVIWQEVPQSRVYSAGRTAWVRCHNPVCRGVVYLVNEHGTCTHCGTRAMERPNFPPDNGDPDINSPVVNNPDAKRNTMTRGVSCILTKSEKAALEAKGEDPRMAEAALRAKRVMCSGVETPKRMVEVTFPKVGSLVEVETNVWYRSARNFASKGWAWRLREHMRDLLERNFWAGMTATTYTTLVERLPDAPSEAKPLTATDWPPRSGQQKRMEQLLREEFFKCSK